MFRLRNGYVIVLLHGEFGDESLRKHIRTNEFIISKQVSYKAAHIYFNDFNSVSVRTLKIRANYFT